MTLTIAPVGPEHVPQLQALVNAHLSAVVPGWGYPADFIARRLSANPDEYILDPWVRERETLCALERDRVVAAAHLLRYGAGPEVSPDFQNVGEVAWLVAWPEAGAAMAGLLAAVHQRMQRWGVRQIYAGNGGPGPLLGGVMEVWPHLIQALTQAGYDSHSGRSEALFGGRLDHLPPPGELPLQGLALGREVGRFGTNFVVRLDDQRLGWCDCRADLTLGGELPAVRGWAELSELWVEAEWRNQGLGAWLVKQAGVYLRLAGCDRIVLTVDHQNEADGAGRFYQRLGWEVLTRYRKGWHRSL